MVRILWLCGLCVISTLSSYTTGAAAHQSERPCEAQLRSLNFLQVRLMKFLKKLQVETDAQYPADKFVRLGAGRAIGPLIAAMKQAKNGPAETLPVDLNWDGLLKPNSQEFNKFEQLMTTYLPVAGIEGKAVVLIVFDETAAAAIPLVAMVEQYLVSHKIPATHVHLHFFTRQDRVDWVGRQLGSAMKGSHFTVRPLALHNEVRHLFRDGSNPGPYDHSQYRIVDVYTKGNVDLSIKGPERSIFKNLVETLVSPQLQ